jgi:uncharacterized phiE125 gp8 family phage protein
MPHILTTPPTVEPISLAEAKAHLRVTHSDDDTYISTLIISARRTVELIYDLALLQQSWSVFADRWPDSIVFDLPVFPLLTIVDIKIYGDDDVAATLDHAHYYLDGVSRPARVILRQGRSVPIPGRRANGIEIKLSAGFGSAANTVPETIKQALLLIIADWFASRGDVDTGQIPLAAQTLLAPFRHVRLA